MKIIKVTPRGFCMGVVKSIRIAQATVRKYPDRNIYMIGLLVHNKLVVEEIKNLGVIVLDDWKKSRLDIINSLPAGSVVIFSAHGTDAKVIALAESKQLICVDTKCEWVLETEDLIKQHLQENYHVIFIGKHDHPETIALTSIDENKISLVTSVLEAQNLELNAKKIFITNQTTLSIIDTQQIYDTLLNKFPFAIAKNDICEATLVRQQAVLALDPNEIDFLYVVGDERSNNTQKLVELGTNKGIKTKRINDKTEINLLDLKNMKTIAVTAGASTANIVQNDVIKYLESL